MPGFKQIYTAGLNEAFEEFARTINKAFATPRVLADIAAERRRQDEKWGEQNHPNGTGPDVAYIGGKPNTVQADVARDFTDWATEHGRLTYADILTEEFFEALAEDDPAKLREELIQVAAVAAAWVEKIDREAQAD